MAIHAVAQWRSAEPHAPPRAEEQARLAAIAAARAAAAHVTPAQRDRAIAEAAASVRNALPAHMQRATCMAPQWLQFYDQTANVDSFAVRLGFLLIFQCLKMMSLS